MNKIVIIAGPTASGKTALGVEIAKILNSEIISCDSMQIYKRMDIGTAKVAQAEAQGVIHRMIDLVEPSERFSVGEYAKVAEGYISDLIANGKIPVVVGGTGLYLDAILYNMSFGGECDEKLRKQLFEELDSYGKEYMYEKLKKLDPQDAEKIHPNNTKRVLRALEIYYTTGDVKSRLLTKERQLKYEPCMAVLNPDRELLYERINFRVDKMFDEGLQNEVEKLISEGVTFDCQSMQAIGYKEFKSYIDKEIDRSALIEKIKQDSRNYAKRQITWLKKYDFAKWFNPITQKQDCIDYIIKAVKE